MLFSSFYATYIKHKYVKNKDHSISMLFYFVSNLELSVRVFVLKCCSGYNTVFIFDMLNSKAQIFFKLLSNIGKCSLDQPEIYY